MKRITFILALLISVQAQAKTDETRIKSNIDNVTVFLSGAQIYRSGSFNIPAGNSVVVMENVTRYIDPKTLQAKGTGEFTIMDVKFETHYPQPDQTTQTDPNIIPPEIRRKMKTLEDSIQTWNYKLEDTRAMKDLIVAEKTMLMNNGMIKGIGKVNDSLELFKAAMQYFRDRMLYINTEYPKLTRKETALNTELGGMNKRLQELRNWQRHNNLKEDVPKGPIYRIAITVSAEKPVWGKMEVSYLVSQASWTPSYDLRADNLNAPIDIQYKAQIRQNTGVEWNKIPITLSTSNPYSRQEKPMLSPWTLSYYNPNYYRDQAEGYNKRMKDYKSEAQSSVAAGGVAPMQDHLQFDAAEEVSIPKAQDPSSFTVQEQNMVSAEYHINLPYTIESNNEPYMVSVAKKQLKADYYLALVPKLDKNAFLIASITDWEDLNLVPASARIYYEGTFVGESFIDPMMMEDTLKLAMGRDNNITAVRKKLKDKQKDKVVGESRVKEAYLEILIRNNHSYSVDLIVEDQVPISNLEEIKVEDVELGKAEKNEYTGILTWRFKLKGGGSEKLNFGYRVKYDKNKNLNLASW